MSKRILSTNAMNYSVVSHHSSVTNNHNEYKESTMILWFDSHNGYDNYIEQTKNRLQQINAYVIIHTELELCLNFLRSMDKENIILITSGFSATQILPYSVRFHQN